MREDGFLGDTGCCGCFSLCIEGSDWAWVDSGRGSEIEVSGWHRWEP